MSENSQCSFSPAGLPEGLEQLPAHCRALIEHSLEGVMLTNAEGTILYVSPAVARISGFSAKEQVGTSVFDTMHPEDVPAGRAFQAQLLLKPGASETQIARFRDKAGRWLWLEGVVTNLLDEPHIQAIVINYRDITARHEADAALRRTQEQLRMVLSATTTALYICTPEASPRATFVSESVTAVVGYSPEEVLAVPDFWEARLHPDDLPGVRALMEDLLREGEAILEYRFRHQDGSWRWLRDQARLVRNAVGNAVEMVGTVVDITQEREVEDRLKSTERRLKALLSTTECIVFSCAAAPPYNVNFVTENVEAIFGYPHREWIEIPGFWMNHVHPEDMRLLLGARPRNQAQGHYGVEYRFLARDGTYRWISAELQVLRDAQGLPTELVGVGVDITARKRVEADLWTTRDRLQFLLSATPAVLFVTRVGPPDACEFISDNVRSVLGYEPANFVGPFDFWLSRIHPDDKPSLDAAIARLFAESCGDWEYRFQHRNGSWRWLHAVARVVHDATGNPVQTVGCWLDVTDQKQAEQASRENERRAACLLNAVSQPILMLDLEGNILATNSAMARRLGRPSEELINSNVRQFAPPELVRTRDAWAAEVVRTRKPVQFEDERAGIRMDNYLTPVIDEQGQVTGITVFSMDITERKRSEEARKALSHRLLEVQETERRTLARELHDEVGQTLTLLKLALDQGLTAAADTPAKLERARSILLDLIARVRNMSLDLRPSMLDDLGLLPALLWQFERYTNQTGIRVIFSQVGLDGRRFGPHIETAAFRVAQEALTNTARHSKVKKVSVFLEADESSLRLQVQDGGGGFDVDAALASGKSSGLRGMFERVRLLGGQMQVNSDPGAGTFLTAELPLSANGDLKAGVGP